MEEKDIKELQKRIKMLEEEKRFLAENIENKEKEITKLKEESSIKLNNTIKEYENNINKQASVLSEQFSKEKEKMIDYTTRRENELTDAINMSNNIITCLDSFIAICKYSNSKIINEVTKEG